MFYLEIRQLFAICEFILRRLYENSKPLTLNANRRKFLQQLAAGAAWGAIALGGKAWTNNDHIEPVFAPDPNGTDDDFWKQVREQFDLPTQIYLNTGTLGLMARPILAEIQMRMQNLSQGKYAIDNSPRQAAARLLNAPEASIAMTHNTTEGINIVAQGLKLKRGDEVILTDQEHVGNALPWLNRMRLTGIRLRVMSPAATAAETLDRVNALITRRTRVIAMPHITCTAGHVLPAKALAQLARDKGLISFFDGAHGPGMLFPDMADLDCDLYASCGHKWLGGPAGTGMLYVRSGMLSEVQPLMVGSYSDLGWEISLQKQSLTGLVETAHRYDYGTQNVALQMGLKAAIEWMDQIGYQKINDRVTALGAYLQSLLLNRSYIEMLTPIEPASRSAIIGFKIKGKTQKDLEASGISKAFRVRFVPESGLDAVRVSPHIYTSHSDLDQFVEGLDRMMQI